MKTFETLTCSKGGNPMPQKATTGPKAASSPKELKDLADFFAKRGYTLCIPFDDIRRPGYIGGFNTDGHEIIIDDYKCLKDISTKRPGITVLGNYKKASTFLIEERRRVIFSAKSPRSKFFNALFRDKRNDNHLTDRQRGEKRHGLE
jgi:hypothetical protein